MEDWQGDKFELLDIGGEVFLESANETFEDIEAIFKSKVNEIDRAEVEILNEYIDKLKVFINNKNFEELRQEEIDLSLEFYQKTGELPEVYKDRLRVDTISGDPMQPGDNDIYIIDTYKEDFSEKFHLFWYDLNNEYGGRITQILKKALNYNFDNFDINSHELGGVLSVIRLVLSKQPQKGIYVPVRNLQNAIITNQQYQYALTTHKNKTAYITRVSGQMKMKYDEKNNIVYLDTESILNDEKGKEGKKNRAAALEILDAPVLSQIFGAVRVAYIENDNPGSWITINLGEFCRALGVNRGKDELRKVQKVFEEFQKLTGVMYENKIYNVFNFVSYDPDTNEYTFDSPYLYQILNELKPKEIKNRKGDIKAEIEQISLYLKSSIYTERNKATAEVCRYLIAGLQRRGVIPDAKQKDKKTKREDKQLVTYEILQSTLIREVEELNKGYYSQPDNNKTRYLFRALIGRNEKKGITKLEECLKKNSYIYAAYKDLKIYVDIPSINKNKNPKIIITHHGLNPDFTLPGEAPRVKEPQD